MREYRSSGLGRSLTLLRTFLIASAAILAVGAVSLSSTLSSDLRDSALQDNAHDLTAYANAVLAPNLEALVVTPVCPHTLASRSLVLTAGDALQLRVLGSFDETQLLLDGQDNVALEIGDEIEVALARTTVRLFQNPDRPFARSLQTKLGWQGSERRSLS